MRKQNAFDHVWLLQLLLQMSDLADKTREVEKA
jgi:hypothetical protein